jgi:uncharacterized protein DUF2721
METHLSDVSRVIQLAVAPVFLLTALGTLITALNNRLGRAVDRRRVLQERLGIAEVADGARRELAVLVQRTRLIYYAIAAAVTSGLLICLVVAGAFVGALFSFDISRLIAVLFIMAMFALIACLTLFLREVFLAVTAGTHHIR